MGKPVPGYDLAIVDDEGVAAPIGEVAHVAVRTDPRPVGLFVEYVGDADATSNGFRNGWYYTGDKASMDADGCGKIRRSELRRQLRESAS